MVSLQLLSETATVHTRHIQVADDRVDGAIACVNRGQAFPAVHGFQGAKALPGQNGADQLSDLRIIIDNQDSRLRHSFRLGDRNSRALLMRLASTPTKAAWTGWLSTNCLTTR